MTKKLMCGIDLHSNNLVCGVVDPNGKRVFEKKLLCDLPGVLKALKPLKSQMHTIAVESTFNWYWLVDGLQDNGYQVVLANPNRINQYNGLKRTDDQSDAFFLAELLRLNILPTGHICQRSLRPVRDMLRRRMGLVHKRTSLMLSLKSLHARTTGQALKQSEVKALTPDGAVKLFSDSSDQLVAELQTRLMNQVAQSISQIERAVLEKAGDLPSYRMLQTLPGVGTILGLTIALETVDCKRFAGPGQYASYCRCVDSRRISNGKKKGENNAKCGNRYLSWAYVEAAHFAVRYDDRCRRFFDRKAAQVNKLVAIKALACKMAKAAWHMMDQQVPYDARRMFPPALSPLAAAGPKDSKHSTVAGAPIGVGGVSPLRGGDRRRRELGSRSTSPPLTRPRQSNGAMRLGN